MIVGELKEILKDLDDDVRIFAYSHLKEVGMPIYSAEVTDKDLGYKGDSFIKHFAKTRNKKMLILKDYK